ncbi:hypothetical protein [Shewanella sp. AC91-MNA-CIBAN-0169]|jgi:hypothetical protein|uniref:hypothetical protein n=3 Tax=unclassified Shewanella TaxID=196818 RepID=UPI003325BC3E
MHDIFGEIRREFYTQTIKEWLGWIVGTFLLVVLIKWFAQQYDVPEFEFHVWVSATLYLWYVSTISLLIGSTYFIARNAQTMLERRATHPQKPDSIDLSNDLVRVKKIKIKAAIIAVVAHLINAGLVYFVTGHVPSMTSEYQLYAVIGVFAIAAIKPAMLGVNAVRMEIFGMIEEADYPQQSVADLWRVVNDFNDYEERLEKVFERIDDAKQEFSREKEVTIADIVEKLTVYKAELHSAFDEKITLFSSSDSAREAAYHALKEAQAPLSKEVSKILAELQNLQSFVIDLRDKNIKGEQLMSALKEFGIESLADLNVSFQKSIVTHNPPLRSVLSPIDEDRCE